MEKNSPIRRYQKDNTKKKQEKTCFICEGLLWCAGIKKSEHQNGHEEYKDEFGAFFPELNALDFGVVCFLFEFKV